jgi:hypothetical protein
MPRRKYVLALAGVVAALAAVTGAYWWWVVGTPREPARATAIANYQKIVRAQYAYHRENGAFPAGIAADKTVGLSWRVQLLPHLGAHELFRKFKLTEPWDSPANRPLVEKMPAVFAPPGRPAPPGHTFVRSTQGPGGMVLAPGDPLPDRTTAGTLLQRYRAGRRQNSTDGTANTILFAEAGEAVPWTKPDEVPVPFVSADVRKMPFNLPRFGGVFPSGFHAALVDGQILFLRHDYPERHFAAMLTPAGGEEFANYEMKELKPEMLVYGGATPGLPELWKFGEW